MPGKHFESFIVKGCILIAQMKHSHLSVFMPGLFDSTGSIDSSSFTSLLASYLHVGKQFDVQARQI